MRKLVIFLLLIFHLCMYAQDIHYSQFWVSTLQLNPALTGMFKQEYRFSGHYRNQWFTVPVNYNTFSISAEKKINIKNKLFLGVGFNTSVDRAGDSRYTSVLPAVSFSTIVPLDKYANHKISLGVQGGLWYRQLDYSNLEFDQQYTGIEFNPALPSGENNGLNRRTFFDLSTGLAYHGILKNTFEWKVGLGIFHLLKPKFSIKETDVVLPLRYSAHLNLVFNLNRKGYALQTDFLFSNQSVKYEALAGFKVRLPLSRYTSQNAALLFGPYYRFNDAIIGVLAAEYRSWLFTFSYDTNVSSFVKATGTYGATELSVTYTYSTIKKNKGVRVVCPIY